MHNRLVELLEKAEEKAEMYMRKNDHMDYIPTLKEILGIYADSLLTDGVIVPPCKVGDTVWVNWENHINGKQESRPVNVYALRFDTKKNNMRICVDGNFEIKSNIESYIHYYNGTFAWNSIGKTVFLTCEEAKAALAARKEDEEK